MFDPNIEKRRRQLQSFYAILNSDGEDNVTNSSVLENEEDSGIDSEHKSDHVSLEKINNDENEDSDNKISSSYGTSKDKILLIIKDVLPILYFGIIESLLTGNFLQEYQMKVLESVLKKYFTSTKLWTIFELNSYPEYLLSKGILGYQPSIDFLNQEKVVNNTQCSHVKKFLTIFDVEMKRKNLFLGLTLDELSYALETLLFHWSPVKNEGKLMRSSDDLKTTSQELELLRSVILKGTYHSLGTNC